MADDVATMESAVFQISARLITHVAALTTASDSGGAPAAPAALVHHRRALWAWARVAQSW